MANQGRHLQASHEGTSHVEECSVFSPNLQMTPFRRGGSGTASHEQLKGDGVNFQEILFVHHYNTSWFTIIKLVLLKKK